MFKKILLITVIILSIYSNFTVFNTYTLAQSNSLESANFKMDLDPIVPDEQDKKPWIQDGISHYINRIIFILASTASGMAVLMIIVGGFLILTATGSERAEQGKAYIYKSIIGLVFVFTAYILVITIKLFIENIFS